MDYEKKYNDALERARNELKQDLHESGIWAINRIFPELAESEDERIRKLLVWQVHRNIEDETNDLAGSTYDGIKGHDPDLEESIEDWKKCLAWLEKQKEPESASASTIIPSCWEEKQEEQKPAEIDERKIINKHITEDSLSSEVNKRLKECGWYVTDEKPAECIEDSVKFEEGFKTGRESGLRDGQKYVLNNLDSYGLCKLCKPVEWSEKRKKRAWRLPI